MRNPWKKLTSKSVYKNNWIEVIEDKVLRPDGKPGIYGYMKVLPGVAVLPIDEEGFVYLQQEFHYPTKTTLLKPASGGVNPQETPLAAAKRELKEELGIIASKWTSLGKTNAFSATVDAEAHLFLAQKLKFANANPDADEYIIPVKIKFKQAIQMVEKGKIANGNTCIILLKAQHLLGLT